MTSHTAHMFFHLVITGRVNGTQRKTKHGNTGTCCEREASNNIALSQLMKNHVVFARSIMLYYVHLGDTL